MDAGRQLAKALGFLKGKAQDVVILALPRGGVVVAKEVASSIGAPMDLVITRKIGAPGNPEFAIGAVTQDGEAVIEQKSVEMLGVPKTYLTEEAAKQSLEIRRRMTMYRGTRPYPPLSGKRVVIVDDGVATGSTIRAAIRSVRAKAPAEVIVAVPVGPPDTISDLSKEADRVVCLLTPEPFYAIGEFYSDFGQVEDETVKNILLSS